MPRVLTAALTAVLLLPSAAGAVTRNDRGVKILGGTVAAPGQFPWMVSIVDSSAKRAINGAYCGGTLIAPRVVITAAHCAVGVHVGEMDVVIGRTRLSQDDAGERIAVSKITIHPGYDDKNVVNDAALLQLATPSTATPLPIAHPADDGLTTPGSRVIVAGWGATSEGGDASDELLFVRLTARSHGYCDREYGPIDDASQLCVGSSRAGEDSCQGDSGGPVMAGAGAATRLVGLVSYGDGCGRKGVPGVYTRVSYFSDWIDRTAAALNGDVVPVAPPTNPPVVRIGKITCGTIYCDVYLRTTGRAPAGGIALNVVRRRSGGRKPVDVVVFAKQLSPTKWKAHVNLPYGLLTLYAIPLTAAQDNLDGDGDVQRIEIYAGR